MVPLTGCSSPAYAGSGGSYGSSSSSSMSSSGAACTCSPPPALPPPMSFDDELPHVLTSITVPLGSSAFVRTSFHGHLFTAVGGSPGELLEVVDYATWWGFLNRTGTVEIGSIQGMGGWGYGNEANVGFVTTAITGSTVAFTAANGSVPTWSAGMTVAAHQVVSFGGALLQAGAQGGTATAPPVGDSGAGDDGIAWSIVEQGTDVARTWTTSLVNVEIAGAP